MDKKKAELFFTAYHIIREGARKAWKLCGEGKAEEAGALLDEVCADAEKYFYDSINEYLDIEAAQQ